MTLDIKSVDIKPKRETFGHVARRIGEGKSATRYEEATYDLQSTTNFHYRPTYNPKYELYDTEKTAIKMEDWYKFLDPRQYYYSNYVMTRAKQQDVAEQNFVFIEKRGLLDSMPNDIKKQIQTHVLPLRHYEWGANMNNLQLVSESYGAAFASAAMFHAEDRLGNSQYITIIGLLIGENEASYLDNAKDLWMNDSSWQGLRKALEDSFVLEDWFELHMFQNVIMDGFIHPLFFNAYEQEINSKGGTAQGMMTEFITTWYEESTKWVDKTVSVASSESIENTEFLNTCAKKYIPIVEKATLSLAKNLLSNPEEIVNEIKQNLINRLTKNGLSL
ncbi:MAG: phenol hydroxylase [Arcobacter sp.]|nr:MAG: phenol hydroxylase [Arcobacter sp.]